MRAQKIPDVRSGFRLFYFTFSGRKPLLTVRPKGVATVQPQAERPSGSCACPFRTPPFGVTPLHERALALP